MTVADCHGVVMKSSFEVMFNASFFKKKQLQKLEDSERACASDILRVCPCVCVCDLRVHAK